MYKRPASENAMDFYQLPVSQAGLMSSLHFSFPYFAALQISLRWHPRILERLVVCGLIGTGKAILCKKMIINLDNWTDIHQVINIYSFADYQTSH